MDELKFINSRKNRFENKKINNKETKVSKKGFKHRK